MPWLIPRRLRSIVLVALVALAAAGARAAAQVGNPVYVDRSPVAWELLRLAREQSEKNEGEAVRLYGELLVEHGQFLVPRQAASRNEFVSVREQVLADLRADDNLRRRYRLMFTGEAQRRLSAGDERGVALDLPLTEPGLQAILRTAQQDLESARFRATLVWLGEAMEHPDLTPARAARGWSMLGLAAHFLGEAGRLQDALAALDGLGAEGRADRLELERLVAAGPGPDLGRGVTSLDRTHATDLEELVAQTIWSTDLTAAPLNRLFPESPVDANRRSAGFDRKRREGDLTTVAATVAGTTVYINEGHSVRALDRFTGRSVWDRPYRDTPRPTLTGRDDANAGDLSIIAVDRSTLVTLTGHAYATVRSGGGKVVCLDAGTGHRRWEMSLDRLGDDHDYEGLFPHGAPIIADGHVYVLARRVSAQNLTGCYVVALDERTGAPEWIRLIASSGSKTKNARPFSTLVYDGGDLFVASAVGAIACLDATRGIVRWLRRYSVPVNVRSRTRQPWEMGGAAVVRDRVIAVTPDERRIVVLDRMTGDELESHPADDRNGWNAPAYLLANAGWVYAVGEEVRAFHLEALDRPAWRLPAPAQSSFDDRASSPDDRFRAASRESIGGDALRLVGRVQLVTGALIVPTLRDVLLVEEDTGRVAHRLGLESSGNPIASGAQLLIAGADSLRAYMSLARAEQMLRERIAARPDDPEPALSLVQLGMRVRNLDLSLEAAGLSLAALERGPERPRTASTRRELFNMLLEIHHRRIATKPAELEALYGMIGTVAANAEQQTEHLLVYGDGLANWAPDRAVESYQSILSRPLLAATMRDESGLLRPARFWAAQRLGQLIVRHGAAIYAPQADFAQRSFSHLASSGEPDPDALAALSLEFPYAAASVEAALAAARIHRDRGSDRLALGVLSAALHLGPTPDRRRRLLGAFVETCRAVAGDAGAVAILDEVARRDGDLLLETTGGSRPAAAWRAALAPPDPPARNPRIGVARPGDHAVVAKVLPGTLLLPPARAGAAPPADGALLLEGQNLSRISAVNLETVWTTTVDDPDAALLQFDSGAILLSMGQETDDPRIVALDPQTGRERWSTPRLSEHLTRPLARERGIDSQMPDGMPFLPGATLPTFDDGRVYLVQRSGGVAAFDRSLGGAWVWSAERVLEQVHVVLEHPLGLILAGMDRSARGGLQPRIAVLDPATGHELHRLSPRTRSGVIWMQADPFGSLLYATPEGLELVDLIRGRLRWMNLAYEALEARQSWRSGDRVIVESRTGSLFTVHLEDGDLSEPFDTDSVRGNWERDALRTMWVEPNRLIAHFRDRAVRFDPDGAVLGADIVTDTRDYRWLLPAAGRLVVVSQHDTRQVQIHGEPGRQTQRHYRIYILTDNCKLDGEIIALRPITKRLRRAAAIDGYVLLSTDAETLAVGIGHE